MDKPLNNDTARCYGGDCGERDSCKRFRTIKLDGILDGVQGPQVRSFYFTLIGKNGCEDKIPLEMDGC